MQQEPVVTYVEPRPRVTFGFSFGHLFGHHHGGHHWGRHHGRHHWGGHHGGHWGGHHRIIEVITVGMEDITNSGSPECFFQC
jgi:hypothetical protein